jgi:putative RNA 2'-phosphotransferase
VAEDARLSRTLSFWLRHRPDDVGLLLDQQGWTDVDAVLTALAGRGMATSVDQLCGLIARNDKQRFELTADNKRIRARQGHSIRVDLDWPVQLPPGVLYHGTIERFLPRVLTDGLLPMGRHHVHLSADVETAHRVGARRGPPVVLAVRALALHRAGAAFFVTANHVWLTATVPPGFIQVVGQPIS